MARVRTWLVRWAPVVVYMAIIFDASAQTSFPAAVDLVWDKARHASAFAVLGLLWVWGLTDRFQRPARLALVAGAWLLTVLYGASDEWHQSFVPMREMDPLDWLADTVGATVTAVAVLLVRPRRPQTPPLR